MCTDDAGPEQSLVLLIFEPRHEISHKVVCVTSKCLDQPGHMRSLVRTFVSRLNILWILTIKLLTEHNLEFLSLKVGCTGSSESTLVKVQHFCESRVEAHLHSYIEACNCFIFSAIQETKCCSSISRWRWSWLRHTRSLCFINKSILSKFKLSGVKFSFC